jgi:putative transposase
MLEKTLSLCQKLCNVALEQRILLYKQRKISLKYKEQQNQLPELKNDFPQFFSVHSQVLQDVLRRLDRAFDNFFRRLNSGEKPEFTMFKSKTRYKSLGQNIIPRSYCRTEWFDAPQSCCWVVHFNEI